jgi:UDPglucose 6-dehydrogenase
MIGPTTTVAVLGLAYKPYSHVLEESQGVTVAKALAAIGAQVVAYDPLVDHLAGRELGGHITMADSVAAALRQADIVVITTPDPAFHTLKAVDFRKPGGIMVVLDCWRILAAELAGQQGVKYLPLGRSTDDAANAARLAELWAKPL